MLTGPQVADIVNRELDRQSDIRNLNRESLRSFRNDMTDVTDVDDPQDMINRLISFRERYNDAGREGLSEAIDTILTQIDTQVRSNRQRAQAEVRPNTRHGTNVMDAYYEILRDNNQFRTPEEMDALRALPQLIRRPGATRNSLGIGQFDTELASQLARIFEALYEARRADFENQGILPEGHKDGGSIQSSKNRLLSPNTDEMRLALLKGK